MRECCLLVFSDDWESETAALQHSDNGTDWQPTKDEAGEAIVFSGNDTIRVQPGFSYRINKSAGVASVRMALVYGRSRSAI